MVGILEASSIKKAFGGVIALKNGNFTCVEGRITGLLGANGSGKSTISKIITGLYQRDGGSVMLRGKEVHYKTPGEAKKDGVSMVYQNLSLVDCLTVWENVVLGNETANGPYLDNKSAKALAKEWVGKLSSSIDIEKMVMDLSPSQKQIVEIAKAMCTQPDVLILDEPTAALEQREVSRLFEVMREMAANGVALIFISHRLWEVIEICDDVVIFRNGEDVGRIDFEKDGKDTQKIVSYITGSDKFNKPAEKKEAKETKRDLLIVNRLSYRNVLKNVSFELRLGEVLGIGGLAGQGQDELMLALAGFLPTSCEFVLDGKRMSIKNPSDAIRCGVVLVPGDRQKEGLFLEHTVFDNIIFPRYCLKGTPVFLPFKQYRSECAMVVDDLSVKTDSIDTPVNNLSGGNQQKVVVGKWLPLHPKVLLLADPAKGVDIGAKKDLYSFVHKLVMEEEMSVILYASDNEELVENCDRVLVMYEGGVVEQLSGDDVSDKRITEVSLRIDRENQP